MKFATMSSIGLLMVAIGILLTIIGNYITYSALNDYSQCALSPNTCRFVIGLDQLYLQFLKAQTLGGSFFLYGLALMIIGAIFCASAQVKKLGVAAKEGSSDVPKA
jgi:hypothetical protein